jgi:hypothetical protein
MVISHTESSCNSGAKCDSSECFLKLIGALIFGLYFHTHTHSFTHMHSHSHARTFTRTHIHSHARALTHIHSHAYIYILKLNTVSSVGVIFVILTKAARNLKPLECPFSWNNSSEIYLIHIDGILKLGLDFIHLMKWRIGARCVEF